MRDGVEAAGGREVGIWVVGFSKSSARPSWPGTAVQISMTRSMNNEDQLGFQPVSVYEGVAATRSALLCRSGQGQSQFFISSNNTAASKRIDTNALSVAILLPQRSPYSIRMQPSPEPMKGCIRNLSVRNNVPDRSNNPFDDKQPAIR
jgi:hypothetical protein